MARPPTCRRDARHRMARGTVLPWLLVVMVALIGCASLSVDVGMLHLRKAMHVNGCDAAALAGAQAYLAAGPGSGESLPAATAAALLVAERNGLGSPASVSVAAPFPGTIEVRSAEDVPLAFARIMGRSLAAVGARATAEVTTPNGIREGLRPFGVDAGYMAALDYGAVVTLTAGKLTPDEDAGGDALSGQYLPVWLGDGDECGYRYEGEGGYREIIERGAARAFRVGDLVTVASGELDDATTQAIALEGDPDSLLRQAQLPPWERQEWGSPIDPVTPGNPRAVVVPVVDWSPLESGATGVRIVGFATFYIISAAEGEITGRFLGPTAARYGFTEPDGPPAGDFGTYIARLVP